MDTTTVMKEKRLTVLELWIPCLHGNNSPELEDKLTDEVHRTPYWSSARSEQASFFCYLLDFFVSDLFLSKSFGLG